MAGSSTHRAHNGVRDDILSLLNLFQFPAKKQFDKIINKLKMTVRSQKNTYMHCFGIANYTHIKLSGCLNVPFNCANCISCCFRSSFWPSGWEMSFLMTSQICDINRQTVNKIQHHNSAHFVLQYLDKTVNRLERDRRIGNHWPFCDFKCKVFSYLLHSFLNIFRIICCDISMQWLVLAR